MKLERDFDHEELFDKLKNEAAKLEKEKEESAKLEKASASIMWANMGSGKYGKWRKVLRC